LAADATELVDAGIRADVCAVCDEDVAGERGGVGHNHAVADQTIMRDVRLRHDEAVVACACERAAARSAAVNGDELAYAVAATQARLGRLASVFQILRSETDGDEREDVRLVADVCAPIKHTMAVEAHAVAKGDFVADDAEG